MASARSAAVNERGDTAACLAAATTSSLGASLGTKAEAPSEDVVAAARHAAVSPRSFTAADLADAMRRRMQPTGPQLSPREKEVLNLLAEGLGVSAIARRLFISESTAKTHISKIYDKLGAGNRAQAIMSAIRAGLIREMSANA
jgi:DNA-binding NarL/FixJ family response regulator